MMKRSNWGARPSAAACFHEMESYEYGWWIDDESDWSVKPLRITQCKVCHVYEVCALRMEDLEDDTRKLYVPPAQVMAAKLLVKLMEEDGETPDGAILAIANAEVEPVCPDCRKPKSAPGVTAICKEWHRNERALQRHSARSSSSRTPL